MATLEITEYPWPKLVDGDHIALPGTELTTQQLAVGAASVQSAGFQNGTRLIVVQSDVAARIAIGANPVASNTAGSVTRKIAAGAEYTLQVDAGLKLAVITP